jgi:hypothetical protein
MTNPSRILEELSADPSRLEPLLSKLYWRQREIIRHRAHMLYLQRGANDGHALRDWLQAEREVFEAAAAAIDARKITPANPLEKAASAH